MPSYQDLKVWQTGMCIAEDCYRLTAKFPRDEQFGLVSQIRRASVSVPANIAEGHGRGKRGEYLQFLHISRGSLKELETHLLIAQRVGLCQTVAVDPLLLLCDEEGRMLGALIRSLEASTVQEISDEYETGSSY